jgi:hypothetical protein
VDDAVRANPAIITRHGRPEAVILSFSDWEKLSHIRSFGQLLCEKSDLLYLVDTNILSAAAGRPKPRDLIARMDAHSPELFLSAVTVADDGITKLHREGAIRRSKDLADWLETVLHVGAAT